MPSSPSLRQEPSGGLHRRLLALLALSVMIGVLLVVGPGLGAVRRDVEHASVGWLILGGAMELCSALSYVASFHAVFCPRMSWRLSYQFGMSEQAADSVLSLGGIGGLALGAWALKRGGMNAGQIARKSVAFFFLTTLPYVVGPILGAALYVTGILGHDPNPTLTYGFGTGTLLASLLTIALRRRGRTHDRQTRNHHGRTGGIVRFARSAHQEGGQDAFLLLRRRSPGVVFGAPGAVAFNVAVLERPAARPQSARAYNAVRRGGPATFTAPSPRDPGHDIFRAFGHTLPLGVLTLGYLIGQIGASIPTPGGIGGADLGLVATFTLYHQPVMIGTTAVLTYRAISLWVPGLLGSVAFTQLRRTLRREAQPATLCMPLYEPIGASDVQAAMRHISRPEMR